ncbi:MAG: hypothetical protein ABR510_03640 [Trueperaceae bacterium]
MTVTRIVQFEATPSSVDRGSETTLEWQVDHAGTQAGMVSCALSRQVEGEAAEAPVEVPCSDSLTEVPPAGAAATYVRYRLSALKSPYVAADPYLTSLVTVDVFPGPFAPAIAVAETTGPRQRYNREFVAIDDGRLFFSRTRALDGTRLEGAIRVHERVVPGVWTLATSLAPPAGDTYLEFGTTIEARGSTLVALGFRRVSTGPDVYESVLHVFEEGSTGAWTPGAILLEGEGIGISMGTFPEIAIALAADALIVGLPSGTGGVPSEVRIYGRNVGGANAWGLAATIPSPAALNDMATGFFGTDVDLSEDGQALAIAASYQGDDSCIGAGESVLVYQRDAPADPANWTLIDTIVGSELIGCSTYVEIDGETLAVTAIGATSIDVLVFERGAGGGPNEYGEIRAHSFTVPTYPDIFVFWAAPSVRLRDDTLAVGVVAAQCISIEPTSPCAPGVVQVIKRDTGGVGAWGVDQVLQPNPSYADQGFGVALDISAGGRHVVVGTNPRPTDDPSRGGEVFVFER